MKMSSVKRIAKRSIVGTRVCVKQDNGLYIPGVIESCRSPSFGSGEATYNVVANKVVTTNGSTEAKSNNNSNSNSNSNGSNHAEAASNKLKQECVASQIIGPGFKSVGSGLKLIPNQRVYITFNGREVSGLVINHDYSNDQVLLNIEMGSVSSKDSLLNNSANVSVPVKRKLEDIRLIQSRKSARLQENEVVDYNKLASIGSLDSTSFLSSSSSSSSPLLSSSSSSSSSSSATTNFTSSNLEPQRKRTSSMSSSNSSTSCDVPFTQK